MRGVGALDLRFPRKDDEASFKCSLEPDLLRFGLIGNSAMFFACATAAVWRYSEEASNFEWDAADPRAWHLAILLFVAANSGTQVGLFLMRKSRGYFRALNVEVATLCMAAVNTNVIVVGNRSSISVLFGCDPLDVWVDGARVDEMNHALAVIVMVTYASLFLPFRSHVMWPFPIVTLVLSVLMRLRLGSALHGEAHVGMVWMAALISFAIFGAWRHERTMRLRWLANRRPVEPSEAVGDREVAVPCKTVLEEAGMRTVAESLCDVVVQLDGDLRVLCAEEHLEAFFGRRRMESLLFTDVFADDGDAARFQKLITEVTHEHPSFMNVTISQGPDCRRRTSLLVVGTSGELPSYLVGVTLRGEPHRPCAAHEDPCGLAESLDLPGMVYPRGPPAPGESKLSRSPTDASSTIQLQVGSEPPQQAEAGTQVDPTPTEDRGENTSISWEVFGFVCKACTRPPLRADSSRTLSSASSSSLSIQRSSRGRNMVISRCSDIEQPRDGWLDAGCQRAIGSSHSDIFTGFDGEWVSTSEDCAEWLQHLKIKGEMVVDGRGQICGLQRLPGRILLGGAPMERKDDFLYRYGKSGLTVCFVRVDDLLPAAGGGLEK